jgi:NTP pyrophosphatase (non-canonical NTP hydrolase)
MHIREYQQWLQGWDQARGWDRVLPAHTLVHALEEMGEVARLVLQWEGYKQADSTELLHADLEEEFSDLFTLLFKLAGQIGVDVEDALARGRAKADSRYDDMAIARAMLQHYHDRQVEALAGMVSGQD